MTMIIMALFNPMRQSIYPFKLFIKMIEKSQRYDECHKHALIHKYELGHEWILLLSVG